MIFSRSGRLEERKQRKRLILAIGGIIGLLIFLVLFGSKMLVGFSLLVDNLRGTTPATPAPSQTLILPPTLDPQPIATKSSSLRISGAGPQGLTVIIYVNEKEVKKTQVAKNGTFTTPVVGLKDGVNTISAKLADEKGNTSDLSNILSVTVKGKPPVLQINTPDNDQTVNGDSNILTVSGQTEDDTSIAINGRLVVVKTDNSFSYAYPLNEGDNKLTIIASDTAGNTTQTERNVKYQK